MHKSAVISPCGKFRYRLGRRWASGPAMLFIMLNPSTADASVDDPTIRKCIGFAERNGADAIEVVNLFAFRATDPKALAYAGWPVGPDNAEYIARATKEVHEDEGRIVFAWGANARGRDEAQAMIGDLAYRDIPGYTLRLLLDGTPAHPLMLPYSCSLQRYYGN
ncbi:hypothetical protein ACS15_2299 [Ralstonia insidiosa]|uniref:DUF1643 domain-containing protein n=1 Tax=Ralstonia insidiosa TaxID=190721 RepID=A0AAC9BCN6_9RALS|nr:MULTISPECIES: DUF1643 domain-containing protein [Ralstonia]ANH71481.1 hypothetical protein ACS15_2299 [Ralstonia insidiosa]EPX97251.1 hypothetical protein C404_14345 [Ralstonia sp. AU12-08]